MIEIIALFLISSLLFITAISQTLALTENYQKIKLVSVERGKAIKELNYWKIMADRYPNYSDIYLKIASLEYRLGNVDLTKTYLDKTLLLNPNDMQAKNFAKMIGF